MELVGTVALWLLWPRMFSCHGPEVSWSVQAWCQIAGSAAKGALNDDIKKMKGSDDKSDDKVMRTGSE